MLAYLLSFTTFWAFVGIVLGFGFVIFVHELGHFLAAKWVGIKVTQFAIGFGHALLAYRKGIGVRVGTTEPRYNELIKSGVDPKTLGETEYRFNWIPLGGYVKMLGQEDMDPTAKSADPRAYVNKPIWARLVVISAGVVMNVIFAFLFFVVCFLNGVDFPPAVVGPVDAFGPAAGVYPIGHEGDPAYRGLRPGDEILAVDDEPVSDFMEVSIKAALSPADTPLTYTVRRGGEDKLLLYRYAATQGPINLLWPGFDMPQTLEAERVAEFEDSLVDPRHDLYAQGVRPNMRITAVDGTPVATYPDFHQALTARRGLPTPVTFSHPEKGTVTVQLRSEAVFQHRDGTSHLHGFVPAVRIDSVGKDSPAHQAGVMPGDYLALLGSQPWPAPGEVSEIVKRAGDQAMALTVLRDGVEITLPPVTRNRKGVIGIAMGIEGTYLARVLPNTPAATLPDLFPGSRIVSVNGQPVETFDDLQRHLQDAAAEATGQIDVELGLELAIKDRPTQMATLTLDASALADMHQAGWAAPTPGVMLFIHKRPVIAANAREAAAIGVKKTQQFAGQVYVTLLRLTQGTVKVSSLSGPIGIAHAGTRVAKNGWTYLFYFLGLISVNLAVINFLPIPITDGGHFLFLVIEKIKGSPVSARFQTAAFFLGLALLGSVFLVTLYYDSSRLIFGG